MRQDDRPAALRRAVFLDRDGVLIADVGHLTSVGQIELLPRVPEALARLRGGGWRLIVATNQSAVARGWLTEAQLREIHRVLLAMLRDRGAEIDAVYYCPHHPDGAVPAYRRVCGCRKPSPGLLLRAAEEWHLDLRDSVMVGDLAADIEAGRRAGCRTVLIRRDTAAAPGADARPESARENGVATAAGAPMSAENPVPDYVAGDLWDAARWILCRRDS